MKTIARMSSNTKFILEPGRKFKISNSKTKKPIISFHSHQNKCRCCFEPLSQNSLKILIDRAQQTAFMNLTSIELSEDSSFSKFFCQKCFCDISKCQDFIDKSKRLQQEFQDYLKSPAATEALSQEEVKSEPVKVKVEAPIKFEPELVNVPESIETIFKVEEEKPTSCVVVHKRVPKKPKFVMMEVKAEPNPEPTEYGPAGRPIRNRRTIMDLPPMTGRIPREMKIKRPLPIPRDHLEGEDRRMFCDKCDWSSTDRCLALTHVMRHTKRGMPKKIPKKTCPYCNKRFLDLPKHIKAAHTKKSSKTVECPFCERKMKRMQFELHVRIRHPTVERKYSCQECTLIKFFTLDALRRHQNKKHYSKVRCSECDRMFFDEKAMHKHIYHCHTFEKAPCEVCGKQFQPDRLRDHMKTHNNERRRFTCETCGMIFYKASTLEIHQMRHLKSEPDVKCDLCGKAFYTDESCRVHRSKCAQEYEMLPCEICGKLYKGPMNLSSHVKFVHHKAKYDKKIPCTICNKTFPNNAQFNMHRKLKHGAERQCDECGEKFENDKKLEAHRFYKHQSLRYRCVVPGCVREYVDKPKVKHHLFKHHKELSSEEMEHYNQIRKNMQPT